MFARKNQRAIPASMLLSGLMVMALRFFMNHYLRDEKGMLPPMHPVAIAICVLVLAALAAAFVGARTIETAEGYSASFPPSAGAFLGHVLAAAGIVATVLTARNAMGGTLALVWKMLAFVSLPCLLAAGFLRLRGKQPHFLLHLLPTAFLMVHTVSNYRTWSSEPQMMNYVFALLAIICQMLFVFYHSAFDTGLEWRRKLTFFAYVSVTLSLAAIPGNGYPWLYLGFGLWALVDRPVPRLRRRRPRPFEEEHP